MVKKTPIVLLIMDGFGIRKEKIGNAIAMAKKPNIDFIMGKYPNILLNASMEDVGLPKGQMGNSEVGHMNIGAGRVVYQSLTLINKSIEDKSFFENEKFLKAIKHVVDNNSTLNIMGLLSDGGVHSSNQHIYALIELAAKYNVRNVNIHAILDGRDVDPQLGVKYLKELKEKIEIIGSGKIASISGRYYAMDRDKNLDRVNLYYEAIVDNKGKSFKNFEDYIESDYKQQVNSPSDEFVKPAYCSEFDSRIKDNDAIIFANFRPDRAIEISTIITNPNYYDNNGLNYKPKTNLNNIYFVEMMKYADSVKGEVAFHLDSLNNVLGVYLANKGYKQLRIAETEKYAHVTFFFDGTIKYDGIENPELQGCKRIMIPSPKVATYDLQPEMSAYLVTDALLKQLDERYLDVVIVNYANCDMVGHTAIPKAVIKAVEVVDECVGKIYNKVIELKGTLVITADHGNADEIYDNESNPITSHSLNPVPLIITRKDISFVKDRGKLADIAPTILYLLGEDIPSEMTGNVLIK
ncbi:MAG: 2,3-bisphosphoglycerate-independent phosphoglycerate mutase [Bacilli bacterium]|nr:2,3-bisphosphoglycerate-independent phosphoglycerate mutase [Bacilli bacterium]